MPAIPHVVRRGAVYYWRRRLPSALAESKKSATLILGLRTRDPARARFLAGQISAIADRCFPAAMNANLSQPQLQQIFRDVFTRHLDKLEKLAASERMQPDFDAEKNRNGDRIMGWVYRLLETRGRNAAVDDRARTQMAADGLSAPEATEVGAMLERMRGQGFTADSRERLSAVVEGVGAEPNLLNLELAQATIFRAMSAANFETERRYDGVRVEIGSVIADVLKQRAGPDIGAVAAMATGSAGQAASTDHVSVRHHPSLGAEGLSGDGAPAVPNSNVAGNAQPVATASVTPNSHPFFIMAEGLVEKNAKAKVWDIKTQRQVRQISRLFAQILIEHGVVDLADVRQTHFAALDDLFGALAKSYGKSPRDHDRSLDELRAIGAAKPPEARSLEAGTVNRHITFLGQVLKHVKSRGEGLDRNIDLSLLRRKATERARNKRSTLTQADIDAIFRLPCFTGCAGWDGAEAMTPGPHVFHRALYFAPILLHYTGARREEICGLGIDDVKWIDARVGKKLTRIYYILIRANEFRRLKNVQSVRFMVLHPEVIRLGFFEFVEAIQALGYRMAFPDLKSPTSSSPLGDRLYDEFIGGLRQSVSNDAEGKKVVHSLRKSFGNFLKQEGVHSEIRGDLLGHAGANTTEEIYCDPIALVKMLKEVMKIPNLTKHLERKPIQLLPWVQDKLPPPFSRQSRKRG